MTEHVANAGKALFVILLLIFSYAYAMFQGGFVSWFLFYSVVILVLLNGLFMLFPLRSFSVTRQLPKTVLYNNEKVTITVTLTRKYSFPFLFLYVRDNVPRGWSKTNPGMMLFFSLAKEFTFSYDVHTLKRGKYEFADVVVEMYDLFGLFRKKARLHHRDTVIVLPPMYPLSTWYETRSKEDVATSIKRDGEQSLSIRSLRNYIPGDKLTTVDWKVSAKTRKLVTKEFETEEDKGCTIILDNVKQREELFEMMVSFTASFVNECIQTNIPITFHCRSEDDKKDKVNNREAFLQLAVVQNVAKKPNEHSLPTYLSSISSPFLVYVTSHIETPLMEEWKKLLRQRQPIAIHYFTDEQEMTSDVLLRQLTKLGAQVYKHVG